eukprot:GHVU01038538.1.p1 GENE.GHVU01038538.1~~GHVU01038538.1.p1  ORF type:complete len:143 (+),score=7.86 GHVU01038538.1:91-519(+)
MPSMPPMGSERPLLACVRSEAGRDGTALALTAWLATLLRAGSHLLLRFSFFFSFFFFFFSFFFFSSFDSDDFLLPTTSAPACERANVHRRNAQRQSHCRPSIHHSFIHLCINPSIRYFMHSVISSRSSPFIRSFIHSLLQQS